MPLGIQWWRQILAPWDAQVSRVLEHYEDAILRIDISELSSSQWRDAVLRCREAVELLHTLTVVEQCSWATALESLRMQRHYWGRERATVLSFTPLGTLRICWSGDSKSTPSIDIVSAFFFAFDANSVRPEFHNAMQRAYAAATLDERRQLDAEHRQIPVTFPCAAQYEPVDASVLQYLHSVAALVRQIAYHAVVYAAQPRDDHEWCYRFPFRMTRVPLTLATDQAHERGVSAALVDVIGLGVQLGETITIEAASWFMASPISELGPVLRGLTDAASFHATSRVERVVVSPHPVRLFVQCGSSRDTEDERAQRRQFGAVVSSLSVTRDVQELSLRFGDFNVSPKSSERFLHWLLYALFSKDSHSSISSLNIHGSVSTMDSEAFTSVLAAENPARALLDAADVDDRDLGFAVVAPGSLVTIVPLDQRPPNSKGIETFALDHGGRFRVMQNDVRGDTVDIVVPCYGHCLVPRSSVRHIELPPTSMSSLSAGYSGSISSITFFGPSANVALFPLVRFVGPKLLSLTLQGATDRDDLVQIFAACPNLNELTLALVAGHTEATLLEAYESGSCKVAKLQLTGFWHDGDEEMAPTRFIRTLQDPASALAQLLRHLTVSEQYVDDCGAELFSAYTDMLTANWTLEYLSVCGFDKLLPVVGLPLDRCEPVSETLPISLVFEFASDGVSRCIEINGDDGKTMD